jgi:hypothetical protein
VRDSGKGLTGDELEQAFNAFFSTKQDGMGMGLPISRSIVESHGGKLWAEPNNGPGVTFGFTIPPKNGHTGNRAGAVTDRRIAPSDQLQQPEPSTWPWRASYNCGLPS